MDIVPTQCPLIVYFPGPLARIILTYFDLGDKRDKDIFDSYPGSRELWIKDVGFLDKTLKYGSRYYRQTTIITNGGRMFHSIDDKPCLLVSDDDKAQVEENSNEQWEITHDGEDDPVELAVWAKFGVVHRDVGFALLKSY